MVDGKASRRNPDGRIAEASGAGNGPARPPNHIVCVGGIVVDRTYRAAGPVRAGTSNPVSGSRSFGGVAGNVAANLARIGIAASLISMTGDDESGRALVRHAESLGIDVGGIGRSAAHATAEYIALLGPDGELALGMADMGAFEELNAGFVLPRLAALTSRDWVFADCNLPAGTLAGLIERPRRGPARLAIDVVSTPKAARLPRNLEGCDLLFLNRDEAAALLAVPVFGLRPEEAIAALCRRGAAAVVLTLGVEGAMVGTPAGPTTKIEAVPADIVDVTGAGDALVATTLALLCADAPLEEAVRWGALAAAFTLQQLGSTHPGLSLASLAEAAEFAGTSPPSRLLEGPPE